MSTVNIPEELQRRLAAIAEAKHVSIDALTAETLEDYAREQERYSREKIEDETRWQRYLRTGESISREDMSRKLRLLANRAIAKTG
jgi:predicted transcriptional regulator